MQEKSNTGAALGSYLDRIENIREEKKALNADEKEVFAEAKAHGFDTKIMREVLKIRTMDAMDREDHYETLKLYLASIGIEI